MIVLFLFLWTEVKSLNQFHLQFSTYWGCQSVSSELHSSPYYSIRLPALSFEWGKLICFKMMQHTCHLIKEPSTWRNKWAPNSGCSVSGTKLIQEKVLWHARFLNFWLKKPHFCLLFLSQIGGIRQRFLASVGSFIREIQERPVISEIKDESEPTWHLVSNSFF